LKEHSREMTVQNLIDFFHNNYPKKLSEERIRKMVYLADWRSAIVDGEQITKIQWTSIFYLWSDDSIKYIGLKEGKTKADIKPKLDHVIETTKDLVCLDTLVGSTHPMLGCNETKELDLPELAKEYKNIKET